MKIFRSILLSLLMVSALQAQNFHRLDVPVSEDGSFFSNPWAGGLNAPQWSKANLNNDGKPDLYLFDRNGGVHLPFINVGEAGEAKYEFAPWVSASWPRCSQFAYLRDFNHDGVPDLFTSSFIESGYVGIRVFVGKFQNGLIIFDKIEFPDFETDALFYTQDNEKFFVVSENADLPAIDDLDGDGDLDILALESNGGYVRYFQNMTDEWGYTDDTLIYTLGDHCWGKFYIQPFAQALTLSCSPDLCALDCFSSPVNEEDRNPVHGGATLCTFDNDNDGDKEVLYGDLIYPNLIFGINGGTAENAWMNDQDAAFPSFNTSVDIELFPSSFYLDFDNDGANDIIASTNLKNGAFDVEVGWFYKNTTDNANPDFDLQGTDFMVRDMLDFGTGGHPAFFDYNADGLMDLVVGNTNRYRDDFQEDPILVLFENVGTATEPAFEIVDRDWLGFNQFGSIGVSPPYAISPAFGDMDSDGDLDLVAGERNGSLFYVENLGGPGQPANFGPVQPLWKDIIVGSYSTPFIYDLNEDGLPDLIIGERNGTVNFLPNMGTPSSPVFHPDPDEPPNNKFLGEINTQNGGQTGYSAPFILDFGTEKQLVTGSQDGWLVHYRINPDNINGGPFELLDDKLGNLREGELVHVAFTDLNGDEFLDAVVGNDRGGLGIFTSPITTEGLVDAKEERPAFGLTIFPNPAQNVLTIQLATEGTPRGSFRIFNALGQLSASGQITAQEQSIDLQNLQGGLYFLQVEMEGEMVVQRFTII